MSRMMPGTLITNKDLASEFLGGPATVIERRPRLLWQDEIDTLENAADRLEELGHKGCEVLRDLIRNRMAGPKTTIPIGIALESGNKDSIVRVEVFPPDEATF